MNPFKFWLYTLVGGTAWNTFLLAVGVKLRERWDVVQHYSHQVDIVVVVALLGFGIWFVRRQLAYRRRG